ncbi:MAG: nodulation protein NfeD [Pseudomonadota bacterium]
MTAVNRITARFRSLTRVSAVTFLALFLGLPLVAQAEGDVVVLTIDGAIGVATSDYLASGLEHAEESNASLVIVNMDTPGGLVSSMRDMVQNILNSPIPVATYVTPAGARADSAGTYLLLASHIAAMTPTTHIGAATPVSLTGEDTTPPPRPTLPGFDGAPDETEPATEQDSEETDDVQPGSAMDRKVLNDAVAYIRGLAERYGRNADWAEKAVTEAATLTAREALELNVVEYIAKDQADLLAQLDGHEVEVQSETVALSTANATVDEFEPDWRIKLLAVIANPEIVLLLGTIGLYGLLYEGLNPGALVPGVVGIICLLLAAYALQVIPVNYAGLALIIVGLGLMVAEAFAPSFGALGLGGIAAFAFGSIIMFDSGVPGFGISVTFVVLLAAVMTLFVVWLVGFTLKLSRRGAVSGVDSIVGGVGTAVADFDGEGKVWLEGESWLAMSSGPIRQGQEVVVTAIDGLVLHVEPARDADLGDMQPQN